MKMIILLKYFLIYIFFIKFTQPVYLILVSFKYIIQICKIFFFLFFYDKLEVFIV